jgi:drug/metabolite transporter (DMT)-like permease
MRGAKARRPNHEEHAAAEPGYMALAMPNSVTSSVLPAILPFAFAIFWASSYAAAKIGLVDISPYAFVAVRLVLAAAAAIAMVLALCWRSHSPGSWRRRTRIFPPTSSVR